MAKRFTDTEKYKDPWFRRLEPKIKILFLFMCDDCNHAGIWKENFDLFKLMYGFDVTHEDMLKLGDKVLRINEETYLIQSFIKFQYGNLNPNNKAHYGVIRALNYLGIDYQQYIAPLKELARCTGIGIGNGEGTGIGKGNGITTTDIPF